MKTFVCQVVVSALLLSLSGPSAVATAEQGRPNGTGLIVDSLTGATLPLVGEVGEITIDQAVITELQLVEDLAGQIVGLEVTGTLNGTASGVGALVDQQFTSTLALTSSGAGQCDVLNVDLGPLMVDALGLATIDVPDANVTARGSGAVGSLLCRLGGLLSGAIGGATGGVRGVVNAINRII